MSAHEKIISLDARRPNVEDGFTRLANELFDAILAFPFSQRQLKIVFAIARKTYGYGKKEDDMSLSQIGEMVQMDTANVSRAIGELVKMGVLSKRQGQYGHVLGLQKDYSKWQGLSNRQGVVNSTVKGCQSDNKGVANLTTTIENPKRNYQKKDSNTDVLLVDAGKKPPASKRAATHPDCPHQVIIDLYHETMPDFPEVQDWDDTRRRHLQARWKWLFTHKRRNGTPHCTTREEGIGWFRRYFVYVRDRCGKINGTSTYPDGGVFVASLGWLVRAEKFLKVIEGDYETEARQ